MVKTAGKFVTVMLALVVVVVVIGGAARVVASFGAPGNLAPGSKSAMLAAGWTPATVEKGTLTVSGIFAGSVRGAQVMLIESNVSHGYQASAISSRDRVYPTLLWVIEEGAYVREGDLLAEISSNLVEDAIKEYAQTVTNVKLGLTEAEQRLAMAKLEGEADVMQAEHNLQQARLLLAQYAEGQYPQDVAKQEMAIKLAESELERARDVVQWSRKLVAEGFITTTELASDQLKLDRAEAELRSAKAELELMRNYDFKRQLTQRQSTVRQREFLLSKARYLANTRVRSAEGRVRIYEIILRKVEEHFADLHEQLRDTQVVAPTDGMVIYASTNNPDWNEDPVGEGTSVYRGKDLFKLYRGSTLAVDLRVPPSKVKQMQVGQQVWVRPDGQPDLVVSGHVSKVGVMPDSDYRNPFHMWFPVEVTLDGKSPLKVGVNCGAQVVFDELEGATLVPVEAVQWQAHGEGQMQQRTVMVSTTAGVVPRVVETGMDDTRHVQIVAGLTPGETVLVPPGSEATPGDAAAVGAVLAGAE